MNPIEKLKKLLATLDPNLSKEDIEKALEGALFLLLQIQKENAGEFEILKQEIESKYGKISEDLKTIELTPGPKGEQGIPGKDGENGKDGKDGKDGSNGKDGANGIAGKNGADGKDGIDGKNGLNGSPDTATQIRDKLEALRGDERLDIAAIKGFEERIGAISQRPVTIFGPGKTKILIKDLSGQLDGATKTFTIGTHFGIVGVYSSSTPFAWRPVVDYNEVGRDIVFTAAVDAPSMLAQGQTLIIQYLR